jgi:hypothetical protein
MVTASSAKRILLISPNNSRVPVLMKYSDWKQI